MKDTEKMNKENNMGPKTEACGTPDVQCEIEETSGVSSYCLLHLGHHSGQALWPRFMTPNDSIQLIYKFTSEQNNRECAYACKCDNLFLRTVII